MRPSRHPGFWFGAFALWFAVLWWLSSRVHEQPPGLDFAFSDKLLHFGWFFGGAGLLSAAIFRLKPDLGFARRAAITVLVVALVGVIDEVHQSFIDGRQGNDPGDLLADVLGALAGALVFHPCRRLLS